MRLSLNNRSNQDCICDAKLVLVSFKVFFKYLLIADRFDIVNIYLFTYGYALEDFFHDHAIVHYKLNLRSILLLKKLLKKEQKVLIIFIYLFVV